MKIAFATDYLPKYHNTWGGGEHACLRISQMLSRNGHDLVILSTKPDKIPDGNLNFLKLKVIEDFFPKRIRYSLRQMKSAFFPLDILALLSSYPIIRKINPDVLHLHNIHSLSFSLVIIAKLLRIPVVISIYDYGIVCPIGFLWKLRKFDDYEGTNCTKFHGTHCIDCIVKQKPFLKALIPLLIPLLVFRKKLLDKLLKKIDGFVVLSRSNAEVLENYGIDREKIGVVQIPSEQENLVQEIEENSILFIGWLHPRKGPHVVLKAIPHILREIPTARLYIFGDQKGNKKYKENILRFIEENNLEHSVFLFGRRSHSEVREYLRKANVLVIPETWETIATNTLTEGLVFGKAIVASRVGGSKDYIIEGYNGSLAENNNPIDFANKILSILKDKGLQIKLSKNARSSWEQFFSEKGVYERLINFYKLVCDKSADRGKK